LLPSNCAPVNPVTGIKSAEKDGESHSAYPGHAGSRLQSERNEIAFDDRILCFKCLRLIDQRQVSEQTSSSSWSSDRSVNVKERTKHEEGHDQKMMSTVGRSKRQSGGGKIKLPQALELVEQYGLKECVARTSCELSCTPNIHGRMGRSLYRFMAAVYKRKGIPGIPAAAIEFYRTSIAAGTRLRGQNCRSECKSQYGGCTRQTPALLRMASHIDLSFWSQRQSHYFWSQGWWLVSQVSWWQRGSIAMSCPVISIASSHFQFHSHSSSHFSLLHFKLYNFFRWEML
jgi:hypothetical protein